MSSLKYYVYPGAGEWARDNIGYNQAVRVGDRIECSGQGTWSSSCGRTAVSDSKIGGWHFKDGVLQFPENISDEIDQAFENVATALKNAGGKGWPQVFRVNSYHTDITPEVTSRMGENFKKWMPDHKPIWTEIGVAKLGAPNMNVEIEVVAYDPEGGK